MVCLACGDDDGVVADAGADVPAEDAGTDTGPRDAGPPPDPIVFPAEGPIAGEAGRGSFTFGVATAAAQIEDMNESADWFVWTQPESEGGLGNGTFVGEAVRGFTRQVEDVQLVADTNLDAYRLNPSWARIEPTRDAIDEDALAHYGRVIDALVAEGVKPMLTVHHFSSPRWIDEPTRTEDCTEGPTDTDLCGWHHPEGVDAIIDELAEFAGLLAARYGDRVDEWCTLNEPINYLLASYGIGLFPPGRSLLVARFDDFLQVVRDYVRAHVAVYEAIHANDTVDADGDGVAAHVGYTLSVAEWMPARGGRVSDHPDDVAAAERVRYVYHHVFTDALIHGGFDTDLDGTTEPTQPDWQGKIDFLGVQYYFRTGVTARPGVVPVLEVTPCFGDFDLGSCVTPEDPTKWVPTMRYEYWEPGLYNVLRDFGTRWPDLPLTVTESGIAAENGRRRAEHVVRNLEQIERARAEGVDVRGYYHWSLMDNFEWAEGYEPRFGLYRVDLSTYERTATEGATVLGTIAGARMLTTEQRVSMGGLGPMSPEHDHGGE